jgi:hypothetical protein
MNRTGTRCALLLLTAALLLPAWGCSSEEVSSEEDARLAYMGLDHGVERALRLGMAGFNAATNANILDQTAEGELSGTMTVSGQVDQGASTNKTMRLYVALDDYADPLEEDDAREIHYWTHEDDLPYLELKLWNIPNGTFSGSLTGTFEMTGALGGEVTLVLSLSGEIEPVPESSGELRRVAGTTMITGTATSVYGVFDVAITR